MPLLTIRMDDVRGLGLLSPRRFALRQRAAMEESLAFTKGEVQKPMPVDRGIARGSISTRMRGTDVTLRGEVAPIGPGAAKATRYVEVLELGRRPGAAPPPVQAIAEWMRRKGIQGGRGRAYVIARAIGRRGFKGRPRGWRMFEHAYDLAKVQVPKIFARHFRDL